MNKQTSNILTSRTYEEWQTLPPVTRRTLAPHKFNSSRVLSWAKKLDKEKLSRLVPLKQRICETLDIATNGLKKT